MSKNTVNRLKTIDINLLFSMNCADPNLRTNGTDDSSREPPDSTADSFPSEWTWVEPIFELPPTASKVGIVDTVLLPTRLSFARDQVVQDMCDALEIARIDSG
jgi:hypothetical protein